MFVVDGRVRCRLAVDKHRIDLWARNNAAAAAVVRVAVDNIAAAVVVDGGIAVAADNDVRINMDLSLQYCSNVVGRFGHLVDLGVHFCLAYFARLDSFSCFIISYLDIETYWEENSNLQKLN